MAADADVDFTMKAGDTATPIEATLTYEDGSPVNLAGVMQVLFLLSTEQLVPVLEGDADVVNATAPAKVEYNWTTVDTGSINVDTDFLAEWEVTFADGKIRTFPQDGYNVVRVKASLGGA